MSFEFNNLGVVTVDKHCNSLERGQKSGQIIKCLWKGRNYVFCSFLFYQNEDRKT